MSDEKNDKLDLRETIKMLRLLLLGQLIEITGVLWTISTDQSVWDLRFSCRYGVAKHEVLDTVVSLGGAKKYIEDLMNEVAWSIAKVYSRRQKTKHDWAQEQSHE